MGSLQGLHRLYGPRTHGTVTALSAARRDGTGRWRDEPKGDDRTTKRRETERRKEERRNEETTEDRAKKRRKTERRNDGRQSEETTEDRAKKRRKTERRKEGRRNEKRREAEREKKEDGRTGRKNPSVRDSAAASAQITPDEPHFALRQQPSPVEYTSIRRQRSIQFRTVPDAVPQPAHRCLGRHVRKNFLSKVLSFHKQMIFQCVMIMMMNYLKDTNNQRDKQAMTNFFHPPACHFPHSFLPSIFSSPRMSENPLSASLLSCHPEQREGSEHTK